MPTPIIKFIIWKIAYFIFCRIVIRNITINNKIFNSRFNVSKITTSKSNVFQAR
nr:MAG TPA: hypothetical protein [Caudoviricetes sp.]